MYVCMYVCRYVCMYAHPSDLILLGNTRPKVSQLPQQYNRIYI